MRKLFGTLLLLGVSMTAGAWKMKAEICDPSTGLGKNDSCFMLGACGGFAPVFCINEVCTIKYGCLYHSPAANCVWGGCLNAFQSNCEC